MNNKAAQRSREWHVSACQWHVSAEQSQKAVSAYFTCKQILYFLQCCFHANWTFRAFCDYKILQSASMLLGIKLLTGKAVLFRCHEEVSDCFLSPSQQSWGRGLWHHILGLSAVCPALRIFVSGAYIRNPWGGGGFIQITHTHINSVKLNDLDLLCFHRAG